MWPTLLSLCLVLPGKPARKGPPRRRPAFRRPLVEALEDRTLPSAAYMVTTTADSGPGSLRDAINAINNDTAGNQYVGSHGVDEIDFDIPWYDPQNPSGHVYYQGSMGNVQPVPSNSSSDADLTDAASQWLQSWWRIQPASNLPAIMKPVIINGYTQPGASCNTLGIGPGSAGHEYGDGDKAVLRIELDGRPLSSLSPPGGTTTYGLTIRAGHSTVEGLVIHGFSHEGTPMIAGTANHSAGIQLVDNGSNHIEGNFIGTDVSGTLAPEGLPDLSARFGPRGPMSTVGVLMQPGSDGNVIGTDGDGSNDPGERNVISANVGGVVYDGASDNVVAGNFIGTDRTGMFALGNWEGVGGGNISGNISGYSQRNRIGTKGTDVDAAGERNIISGNKGGIVPDGGFAPTDVRTVVAGNFIGTDVTGTGPLGNLAVGIVAAIGERDWTIGGADPALANTIAYNGFALRLADGFDHPTGPGIWVFDLLGLGAPSGIRIQGNSIHDNAGLGIDLGGVYPSQGPDGVTANDSEDFPKLDAAYGYSTSTLITGHFDSPSQPGQVVTIDLYANTSRGHPFTDPNTQTTSYYGDGETYLGSTTVVTDPQGQASFTAVAGGNLAGQWISATATDQSRNTSEFSADFQAADDSTSSQTFQDSLQSALPNSPVGPTSPSGPNAMTLQASSQAVADAFMAVFSSTNASPLSVPPGAATPIYIQMNFGSSISVNEANLAVPPGFRVSINGGVWHGGSPALTLVSGSLTVSNATFVNATDAPTILVTGGNLTLRNDTIQESTGFSDAAIAVTGGTVDLGTAASPGGNVINVNGAGEFLHNTTPNAIAAAGVSFQANGAALPPRDLSFTTLVGSAAVPLLGDAVTFTAAVRANTPGTAPPGGSVDFFDATTGTDLGSFPLSGGSAALTTSALAVGGHVIWARYGGDDNFLLSQDSTLVTVIPPASLSGVVWEDFNDDGQVDFGERGIAGVTITLGGTDDLGNPVNPPSQLTDSDGAYVFLNLRPGSYYITETQPASYLQGIDTVGTAGGSLAATDQFFVQLAQGVNGLNYNFGERPPAGGSVQHGQTAGIGFWNNKNGQALIKALPVVTNADGSVTSVANWLAATLPNIFGANAGSNNLTGQSNAAVAALFQADFLLKGVKLDAQVLATALSVYATNATLDPTQVAAQYSFTVSGDGAGTATVNVGSNGDAFGVADNTTMTVMDLLLATNDQAVNGLLYSGNATKRAHANNVYGAVNNAGDIG
jgi:hypothetical protein